MEVTTWGGGQSILDEREAVSWCFLMTMAVMCQGVSEEEEARGQEWALRLRGILERGDGWGLVEAEACEGSRDKTQLWEESCDFGRSSDKA